ncbi:MAG: hypothetical protein IPJ65_13780 [Archangiaceae bacterium]|nr:hypothetical protein [Archangiaceae bacterium]
MRKRELGGENHELLPVRETEGTQNVDCPRQSRPVPFKECEGCALGTVVRLKKQRLPFVLCATEGPPRGVLPDAGDAPVATPMHVVTVRHDLPREALGAAFADPSVTAVVVVDGEGVATGFLTRKTYRDNLQ